MLRRITDSYRAPFLYPLSLVTSGGNTVTVSNGKDDLTTVTESTAGVPNLTLKRPFTRSPLLFSTPGITYANGAYGVINGSTTRSLLIAAAVARDGSNVDGGIEIMSYGYFSSDVSRCMPQTVKSSKKDYRIKAGSITIASSAATVNIGKGDFRATSSGTGVCNIVFNPSFAEIPIVLASGVNGSAIRAPRVTNKTAEGCTITLGDEAGNVQDGTFHIVVIGNQGRGEYGFANAEIKGTQRKPRIIAGSYTYSAGTPTATINPSNVTSITDNATGDATLNLAVPFRRPPIVIVNAQNIRAQITSASASAVRIFCASGAGAAADPGFVHYFIIGSDDVSEY
jgi:hypothetical protein